MKGTRNKEIQAEVRTKKSRKRRKDEVLQEGEVQPLLLLRMLNRPPNEVDTVNVDLVKNVVTLIDGDTCFRTYMRESTTGITVKCRGRWIHIDIQFGDQT